jgi:hypothetical protein
MTAIAARYEAVVRRRPPGRASASLADRLRQKHQEASSKGPAMSTCRR